MSNCRWEDSCQIKDDCPAPYCKFSNEENADKIFDLIDEYVELKESVSNKDKKSRNDHLL